MINKAEVHYLNFKSGQIKTFWSETISFPDTKEGSMSFYCRLNIPSQNLTQLSRAVYIYKIKKLHLGTEIKTT